MGFGDRCTSLGFTRRVGAVRARPVTSGPFYGLLADRRGGRSGYVDVVVCRGNVSVLVGQFRVPRAGDAGPAFAHRAALHSGVAEADCRERDKGDPSCREEVPVAAAHDNVAPSLAATPCSEGVEHQDGHEDSEDDDEPRHVDGVRPSRSSEHSACPGGHVRSRSAR